MNARRFTLQDKKRAGGVLLHITSLPSKYGIGDFGPQARRFADFLAAAKQSCWQVLPLNALSPVRNTYSPYNGLSAYAGNTLLISPEILYRRGLLTKNDIRDSPAFSESQVQYSRVISYKTKLLNAAYERFRTSKNKQGFERFCAKNRGWLEDFAVFAALRRRLRPALWCDWPAELRDREKNAVESARLCLWDVIEREKFSQYLFFEQWFSLKRYCGQRGISLIGDVPIYVAYDSADVWARPGLFRLTKTKRPYFVAGVPPDLFSRTGQLWGNPVYNWRAMKNAGYRWWLDRMKHNLTLFDAVRIDHFRGFFAYWQVPASHKTAAKGRWVKGPGDDFFDNLFRHFPASSIIAEDLGYITADVKKFIAKSALAGMKVLLFAFGGRTAGNPHCPYNHPVNSVVYTGTHDNNTARGWFEKEAGAEQKKRLFDYLGHKVSADNVSWEMVRLAAGSVAMLAVVPMQDILGLGAEARMNQPATIGGNWRWRLINGQITPKIAAKLAELTQIYGRA